MKRIVENTLYRRTLLTSGKSWRPLRQSAKESGATRAKKRKMAEPKTAATKTTKRRKAA
jgi:hypothetical protein